MISLASLTAINRPRFIPGLFSPRLRVCLGIVLAGLSTLPAQAAAPNARLLRPVRAQDGQVALSFYVPPWLNYEVQQADSLETDQWHSVQSGPGSTAAITLLVDSASLPERFFRMVTFGDPDQIPATVFREIATRFYDSEQNNLDLTADHIEYLCNTFRIPVIDSQDGDGFRACRDEGRPFLLDFQAARIAEKFNEQYLVTLDTFASGLGDRGARLAGTGESLNVAGLTARMRPLVGLTTYRTEEALAALVLAFGQERASRYGGANSVWGDDYLDSIQFHLLLLGAAYSGSEAFLPPLLPRTTPTLQSRRTRSDDDDLINWSKGKMTDFAKGKATDFLSNMIDFPLGEEESAKAVLCTSILIYSYKVTMTAEHKHLTRKAPGATLPHETRVEGKVEFDFEKDDTSAEKDIALALAGCETFPPKGPQAGTEIVWSLRHQLPEHGHFTEKDLVTWQNGTARATYTTFYETVPRDLRGNTPAKDATGLVEMKIKNMLPTQWANFEVVVRETATEAGGKGEVRLSVRHYEMPQLIFSLKSQMYMTLPDMTYECLLQASFPLQLHEEGQPPNQKRYFSGQAVEDYSSFTMTVPECVVSNIQKTPDLAKVTIPLPADLDEPLEVQLIVGSPNESMSMKCPDAPITPMPATQYWYQQWFSLHMDELSQTLPGPTYVISDMETGGEPVLMRRLYSRPFAGFGTESSLLEIKRASQ